MVFQLRHRVPRNHRFRHRYRVTPFQVVRFGLIMSTQSLNTAQNYNRLTAASVGVIARSFSALSKSLLIVIAISIKLLTSSG